MKYGKILLLSSLSSLGILCTEPESDAKIDINHAFDYSSKNVCEDSMLFRSDDVGVTKFLKDCGTTDDRIRQETNEGIGALKVRTGFLADEGIAQIISSFKDNNFLKDLKVLDLSYNRATKKIFSQVNFDSNLKTLLNREKFKFLDICGNYVASPSELKDFFATLEIGSLTKIIWIHEGQVRGPRWAGAVSERDSKPRSPIEIKQIKNSHLDYYNYCRKIEYNNQLMIEGQERPNITNLKISDWKVFLDSVTATVESVMPVPEQVSYGYLIQFSRDEDDKDLHENRLDLAKRIYHEGNFRKKEEMPSLAARMFYTIKDDEENIKDSKIRGEAAYYLSDIYKSGAGLPYDREKADQLFEQAKELGYQHSSFPKRGGL